MRDNPAFWSTSVGSSGSSKFGRCLTNLRTASRCAYLVSWKRTKPTPHPGPNPKGPRTGNQRPPGHKAARQRHQRPQRQPLGQGERRRPPSDRPPRRPQGLAHNSGLSAPPSPLTTSPSNAASPQITSSTTGLPLNEASSGGRLDADPPTPRARVRRRAVCTLRTRPRGSRRTRASPGNLPNRR